MLATLKPVPKSKCTISIAGSPASVNAEIVLRRGRSNTDQRQPLSSQPAVIELEPDDYAVSVRLNNEAAETTTPMPVDLYDDRNIVFKPAVATEEPGWSRRWPKRNRPSRTCTSSCRLMPRSTSAT